MTSDFKLIKFIIQSLAAVALAGGGLSLQPLPLLRDLFFYVALRVEFFLGNNVFGQLNEGIVDVVLGLGAGLEVQHALGLGVGLIISVYFGLRLVHLGLFIQVALVAHEQEFHTRLRIADLKLYLSTSLIQYLSMSSKLVP